MSRDWKKRKKRARRKAYIRRTKEKQRSTRKPKVAAAEVAKA